MKVTRRKKKVQITTTPVIPPIRPKVSVWDINRIPIRRQKTKMTIKRKAGRDLSMEEDHRQQIEEMNRQSEKLIKCQFCEKKFKNKSLVTRHERTHTKEMPYACELCGARFAQISNRNAHRDNVCLKLKKTCKFCGELLSGSANMKHHLDFTHKMKDRLECHVCGISVRSNLKRHCKTTGHINAVRKAELVLAEESEKEIQAQRTLSLFDAVTNNTRQLELDNLLGHKPNMVSDDEVAYQDENRDENQDKNQDENQYNDEYEHQDENEDNDQDQAKNKCMDYLFEAMMEL